MTPNEYTRFIALQLIFNSNQAFIDCCDTRRLEPYTGLTQYELELYRKLKSEQESIGQRLDEFKRIIMSNEFH